MTQSSSAHLLRQMAILSLLGAVVSGSGCAAFHPVRGVPASYMPAEYQAITREDKRTIDLGLLVKRPPDQHRVEAGDILTVFVPGVLGRWSSRVEESNGEEPPINIPMTADDPPTLGYPVQVRDDNSISLPQLPPLNVYGRTLQEVEDQIRDAYASRGILRADPIRVMVSLFRPREFRILVVRQEAAGAAMPTTSGGVVNLGSARRGIAREVRLRAYENDVMHALSRADIASGLPGLDAENTIYIIRNRRGPRAYQPEGACPPASGFMQIPAGDLGGHSVLSSPSRSYAGRQPIRPVGHQPIPDPQLPVGGYSAGPPIAPPVAPQAAPHGGSFAPPPGYQWPTAPAMSQPPMAPQPGFGSPIMPGPGRYQGQGAPMLAPPQAAPPMLPNPPIEAVGPTSPTPLVGDGHSIWNGPAPPPQVVGPSSPYHAPVEGGSPTIDAWHGDLANVDLTIDNPNVTKIPVRISPGETLQLTEEDITLYDGDIIFIESRETEVFYTGGLLGGGQFTLPRDYDLHALEAISIAQATARGSGSTALSSAGGQSALNQDVVVSASRLVILRKLPCGQQVPIEIDLYRAMRYPQENITIQAGDYLLLQYKCGEAIAACIQRNLLEGALIGVAAGTFTGGR
jgi:hypothetical protein